MMLRVVALIGLGVIASGCINSASLIKIKPDGSGTLEQTMLVNLAAIKGLMAGMGAGQTKETGGVLNEAEFKRTAERLGMRPVSLTPMKEGGFEGGKAIFAFDDITKVRVDQDPQLGGRTAGIGGGGGDAGGSNPIKFGLARQGANSVLTITVDEKVTESATTRAQDAPSLESIDPAMLQMIKTMFDGFRILIDVEVDGKIVKTNADYVAGSRITLLEVDMAGVFADEAKLKALQSKVQPGSSISELRPYLKDIKGVKINHSALTVEFR
jgi:hypothetical protein